MLWVRPAPCRRTWTGHICGPCTYPHKSLFDVIELPLQDIDFYALMLLYNKHLSTLVRTEVCLLKHHIKVFSLSTSLSALKRGPEKEIKLKWGHYYSEMGDLIREETQHSGACKRKKCWKRGVIDSKPRREATKDTTLPPTWLELSATTPAREFICAY